MGSKKQQMENSIASNRIVQQILFMKFGLAAMKKKKPLAK